MVCLIWLFFFEEMRNFTRNIVDAVNIPVMADANWLGNAINAMYVTENSSKLVVPV